MTSSDPKAIIPALHFSRDHLAPRASINPKFKHELEEAMSLIVYTHDKLEPPLLALLDPQLKQDVADSVNKAILKSLGRNSEAKIKALIRLRTWAEQKARDAGKDIVPPTLNIGLDQDKSAGSDETMHENGQSSGLDADAMVS
jgi:glucose-induced degradation protein 8